MKVLALVVACSVVFASPALAQMDTNLRATYGSIGLSGGFTPDPYRIQLTAGGDVSVSDNKNGCTGYVSRAPDFELNFSAGSLPLVFRTISSVDTTLIINAPDGRWYCDDDSYGDGDAEVRFNRPQTGVYDVWVGTYNRGNYSSTLLITETP